MPSPLNDAEIQAALPSVPQWKRQENEIRCEFKFADFAGAMAFVNKVAEAAESADHHPDITINYNRVTLALSSHDAGGLTNRDFKLARTIDSIVATSGANAA